MGAPVCLEYRIEGNDFMVAGAAICMGMAF